MECITLRELYTKAGVTRRAVQCYEAAGLLKSVGRNASGHLLYRPETVERIKAITFFRKLEFSLKEIGEIIDGPNEYQKEVLEKRITYLYLRREEISDLIKQVQEYLSNLTRQTERQEN